MDQYPEGIEAVATTQRLFRTFHRTFPYIEIDPLIAYFSVFGGMNMPEEFSLFNGVESTVQRQIVVRIGDAAEAIAPSYLMEEPYRSLLTAAARGDGKLYALFRRARLRETVGRQVLGDLVAQGVLRIEASREAPIRPRHGEQLPRALRRYRIQSKARFVRPFERFWFGFVAPFFVPLMRGESQEFWGHFRRHRHRIHSWVFEQLSLALLVEDCVLHDAVHTIGSWWDRHTEYDVLAFTEAGKMIVGECKYTGRSITRGAWTKLREKAAANGFAVDTWALFSRRGFSRELAGMADAHLRLYAIEDFSILLRDAATHSEQRVPLF